MSVVQRKMLDNLAADIANTVYQSRSRQRCVLARRNALGEILINRMTGYQILRAYYSFLFSWDLTTFHADSNLGKLIPDLPNNVGLDPEK